MINRNTNHYLEHCRLGPQQKNRVVKELLWRGAGWGERDQFGEQAEGRSEPGAQAGRGVQAAAGLEGCLLL